MLKISKPTTLMQVFEQTKWQEVSNYAIAKKNKLMPKPPANGFGRPIGLEDGRGEFFETEEHGEVKTMEEDGIEDLGYL
ncbi:hypothetical protein OIU76_009604 [Salix suchowensis]|nr:hypothetical protein OIU76_009604 [Salix suchowensis]